MQVRIDEKGKYYTDRVTKEPLPVVLSTGQHTILGTIHLSPGNRLKDELNSGEQFLALTNVDVFDTNGTQHLHKLEFMVINSEHLIWIAPAETIMEEGRKQTDG